MLELRTANCMRNRGVMPRVAGYHPSVGEMLAVVVLLDGAVCVNRVLFDSNLHAAHLYDESCICIPTR